MLQRWRTIHENFGVVAVLKTLLMLLGLVACALLGWFWQESPAAAVTALVCLVAGVLFRNSLERNADRYPWLIRRFVLAYAFAYVIGQLLALDWNLILVLITAATAGVFHLNYWCLSAPGYPQRSAGD